MLQLTFPLVPLNATAAHVEAEALSVNVTVPVDTFAPLLVAVT
jgi:hypothetical protein